MPTDEQALARDMFEELVTSKGTKKVATLAQLVVALAAEPDRLGRVAEKLVQARLLRFVEWADAIEPAYELAHEYLIEQISVSSELKQRKQGEELLQHEMENWLRFDSLMGNDRFDFLNLYRDTMRLSFEQAAFMLRCAIRYSRELEYWIEILGARDAVRILADILNEKEAWTKQLDRVNALRATLYLPSDMYEPLLCQYALLEKHALAKEARSLLRAQNPETRERIAHHFYNLWLSQEENERKGILYVLAELDSPMATTALDEILQMQSESERLECIEIIAEAEPNQAQELRSTLFVMSLTQSEERAAKYLHKAPAVNVN